MRKKEHSKAEGGRLLFKKIVEILKLGKNDNSFALALRIASIYVVLGAIWIIASDKVLSFWGSNKEIILKLSVLKGWIYVGVTGLIIFSLIHNALKRVKNAEKELLNSYHALSDAHDKLQDTVHHDFLTGLPNRLKFYMDNRSSLGAQFNVNTALFVINVDNFKLINDSLGHSLGDQIILSIAHRLNTCYRGAGRLYGFGGDEFALIMDYENLKDITALAESTIRNFEEPIQLIGNSIHITLSIGIATYPDHGTTADQLLKSADIAMCKAKGTGKNRYVLYSTVMNDEIVTRTTLEKHLRRAIKNEEFHICYQPQIDTTTQKTIAFEALLRWKNPELGNIPPDKFIKVAEETSLIIPIGKWILYNACSFIKKVHGEGYDDVSICVNISIIQLMQNNFVNMILELLDSIGLDPKYLELEITESIMIESYEIICKKLDELKRNHIRIAIDDFGTGYSSLNYLKILPINTLKIDKSFLKNMSCNQIDQTIVEAVVEIGNRIGLNVVAEGIETQEQLDCVVAKNCSIIQGYYFCKPMVEDDAYRFLEKTQPTAMTAL